MGVFFEQLVLGIRLRASLNTTVWLQRKRTGLTQLQKMVVEVEEAGIFVMFFYLFKMLDSSVLAHCRRRRRRRR